MSRTVIRTEPREKLPETKGTIQIFYSSEVRRDRDGKVMRDANDRVMRGYYGLIHNDELYPECDPLGCREKNHQVRFKNEVLNKANFQGAALRGAKGEEVRFAARPPRSEKEGERDIVVFMRSADRPEKTIPEHGN